MEKIISDQFKVSEQAFLQLSNLITEEDKEEIKGIRIFVSSAGCGGVQYGMTFADSVSDADFVVNNADVNIYVDAQCLSTMDGIEVDFAEGPNGASFVFNNTKPQTGCASASSCSSASESCA